MPLAYIALGSNLGDRLGQIRRALDLLRHEGRAQVLRSSPVYHNRAVGMGEAASDFLNAVVEVETALEPQKLLDLCLDVERQLGRTRSKDGWIPRTIDLDILFYEGISLNEEHLVLPHPRIAERDFVAVPLADLVPELEVGNRRVEEIAQCLTSGDLKLYPEASGLLHC